MAESAFAALDQIREVRPEIVFSDISMPRMNGYELARRLREQMQMHDVVVVAMTGYGQLEDRELAA